MQWTSEQRERLAIEHRLLQERGMEHFQLLDPRSPGVMRYEGWYTSSVSVNYRLKLIPSPQHPDILPALYVSWPLPLIGHGGVKMTSYGTSHPMHTWASDWEEFVKICHWKQEFWSPSNTLLGVLLKGFLWIESFEIHRRTGATIHDTSLDY